MTRLASHRIPSPEFLIRTSRPETTINGTKRTLLINFWLRESNTPVRVPLPLLRAPLGQCICKKGSGLRGWSGALYLRKPLLPTTMRWKTVSSDRMRTVPVSPTGITSLVES